MKPLFKEPFGKSERKWGTLGTTRAVTCELCGTDQPELSENGEESYHLIDFLGYQVIEECCGGFIDAIYNEFDGDFTKAYLYEFAKNPGDQRFDGLRWVLKSTLKVAHEKLTEQLREVYQAEADFEAGEKISKRAAGWSKQVKEAIEEIMGLISGQDVVKANNGAIQTR